jgi:3'(2'), 5'-bisphosphate nucleotidase
VASAAFPTPQARAHALALVPPLLELMLAVRRELLRWWRAPDLARFRKDDGSPVTSADRAAHRLIADALAQLAREIPLVSEEAALPEADKRLSWERYWLVDPLDGTRDFAAGGEDFVVCLALMWQGRPLLGVIDWPLAQETYWGVVGHGAFRVFAGQTEPLTGRPGTGARGLTVAVSSHHRRGEVEWLRRQGFAVTRWVPRGSALKFCLVARGSVDGYVRRGKIHGWDIAAGHALVEAAGGSVWDLAGGPLSYSSPDLTVPGLVAWGPGRP